MEADRVLCEVRTDMLYIYISAVSRKPLKAEGRVRSLVCPYEICDGQSGTGDKFFSEYLGFSPAAISTSVSSTHSHQRVARTRKTNGEDKETSKKMFFQKQGSLGLKQTLFFVLQRAK